MDTIALQQKLNTLARYSEISKDSAYRLGLVLSKFSDWQLFRINPIRFAKDHGFATEESISLFLHGAKIGLFDFTWNLICPNCGRIEHSFDNLNQVQPERFGCTLCRIEVSTELDDHIEVAFTINPLLHKLKLDPYTNLDQYRRYFFTQNITFSQQQQDYIYGSVLGLHSIQANQILRVSLTVQAREIYQVASFVLHHSILLEGSLEPPQSHQEIHLDLLPSGFSPLEAKVSTGQITLQIHNRTAQQVDILLKHRTVACIVEIVRDHPPQLHPMLTGKILLNNHFFRKLFRTQELRSDLRLSIRSLTILFTDLKGSTDLYDHLGDAIAYNMIQKHFVILSFAVHKNAGTIVKTMGDAIMATFSSPQEGVQAALDMVEGIHVLNNQTKVNRYELGLKIGLHEGTVLAVNAEQHLDYFGQTVNIAARVQGLSGVNEIWLSHPVYEYGTIKQQIQKRGYVAEKCLVQLKGVSKQVTVFRMKKR